MELYTVGVCPVGCSGSVDLIALKNVDDGCLVFYCPACGLAWDAIPEPYELSQMKNISDYAPNRVELAGKSDLDKHGIKNFEITDSYNNMADIL